MIESGEAVAIINGTEVMKYGVGDYFGERALIKNEPRAADVKTKSMECTVVTVDRHSFKRLLGPMEDILKRKMDVYEQFKGDN